MKKATNNSTSGTSFHGTTVLLTRDQLTTVLGPGNSNVPDGMYTKVQYEWDMQLTDGKVFTVYDWKEYRKIDSDEEIYWHIGGFDKETTERAKVKILINLLK